MNTVEDTQKKFICENCSKEHDGSYGSGRFCSKHCRCSFNAKKVKHRSKPQNFGYKKSPSGTWKCRVCGEIFETKHKMWDHLHKEHPADIKEFHGKGLIPWNKGLTKETDIRIALSREKIKEGYKSGRLFPSFKGKHHSLEDKKQMSKKRKDFLNTHPNEHPWKKSSKFKSVPCEYAKELLRNANIKFEEEFKPLSDRNFSIDITFPKLKIGIEINGNQHYSNHEKGILAPYYQERHDLIEQAGWKLFEFHYASVYHDDFLKMIFKILNLCN